MFARQARALQICTEGLEEGRPLTSPSPLQDTDFTQGHLWVGVLPPIIMAAKGKVTPD